MGLAAPALGPLALGPSPLTRGSLARPKMMHWIYETQSITQYITWAITGRVKWKCGMANNNNHLTAVCPGQPG